MPRSRRNEREYPTVAAAVLSLVVLTRTAWAADPIPTPPQPTPPSCELLLEEQRKCALGVACDKQAIARLRRLCLRDGGRP